MKAKIITSIALAIIVMPNLARAACVDLNTCLENAASGYCCCNSGTSHSEYYCDAGYTLSGTTCSRADTTGSDETGTYVISYGTCDAHLLEYDCYVTKLQSSIGRSENCMCNMQDKG